MKNTHIETKLIHAGATSDTYTGAVNAPIYQSSTYYQQGLGKNKGYEYSRTKNPTRDAAESLIAELENGTRGFAFSSGMAAISAVLSLFRANDEIIILSNVYGGTFRVIDKIFSKFDLKYKMINDISELEKAISKATKALLYETPANPLLNIIDIEKASKIAKKKGILSIVDNTFMSPYLQRPLELGADIVVHSATKYLGGHSDLIAGLVVVKDRNLGEELGFIQNATGAILAPFDSFLLVRGIKTLGLRMQRHSENALQIATFLQKHKGVNAVYYPALKSHENAKIHQKQASGGGGVVSFELDKAYNFKKFVEITKLFVLAESLGGVESLLCHPASMTHASIPEKIRQKLGIKDNLLRLSVGIENIDDLIKDLENAFKKAKI